MDIMTHTKFHFNRLMLTLISGIQASYPPPHAWRTTEKAGPDRVKNQKKTNFLKTRFFFARFYCISLVIQFDLSW